MNEKENFPLLLTSFYVLVQERCVTLANYFLYLYNRHNKKGNPNMKTRAVLVPICFFSLLFSSSPSSSPSFESKRKYSAVNLINDAVSDATVEEQLSLSEKRFYQFVSNDMTYYVADEFQDIDDSSILIRTMDDFSEYPYLKTVSLDPSKRAVEYQRYDSISNEFTKEFRYIPDSLYCRIRENAMEVDKEEGFDTYSRILNAFQYEIDHVREAGKENNSSLLRSSPGKISYFLDTSSQANLDLFIENRETRNKNTLFVNNAAKATIDDEITQLIPKKYFGIPQTREKFGTEWGFYMDTYSYGFSQYLSEVFLFDVEIMQADQDNAETFVVTPVVNATYLYDSNSDIVSFFQENTFGIANPLYTSNITYVSDYIETYNDYDELEYEPINEHPLNPNETGYLLSKDNGLFFSDYGFLSTQKTTNSFSNAIFKLTFDATKAVLLDLIPNNLVSLAIGKTVDGIGLLSKKIVDKINENVSDKVKMIDSIKKDDDSQTHRAYLHINENYDPDINKGERNKHKLISFDLSNQSDIFISASDDSISFYAKIVNSKDIDNSYKGLISHFFSFDLAKGTASKHQTICSLSNNIGYTCQPTYQTGNMSISNPLGVQKETFIQLGANNPQPFELKFTAPKDGNYLFSFSNLSSKTQIIFPNSQIFNSGEYKSPLFNIQGYQMESTSPIYDHHEKEITIKKGTAITIQINKFEQTDDAFTFFSGLFSMCVYQLEDPITGFADIQSALDDSYGEYSTSSSYQTISFRPKITGLHTLSMYNDTGTCSFLVTDSKGRTLYEMYSADSERSIILNLKGNERYFIHFYSYSNSHKVKFFIDSCRYLPSVLSSENTNYSYVKKNIEFTFLYNPYADTTVQFSLQPTSVYANVSIYDYQHRLLESPDPSSFSFSFSANRIYYIQIRFMRYDSNLINPAYLQVKGA